MNNIYLIGMPGCGKSTIGERVAAKIGYIHCDTDEKIEQKAKLSIPEIFSLHGEEWFRRLETECLREIALDEHLIVSTGGGIVTKDENLPIMRQSGKIILIDSSVETILKNSSLEGRPLLKDKNAIYALYEKRIKAYKNFADIIIENNGEMGYTIDQMLIAITKEQ